jgi:hypothetical protein
MTSSRRKREPKATGSGKHFERLTAALHVLKHAGADVRWNDRIAGRQVDVSVRFQQGSYEFLVVIECRDTGRKLEVEAVDAFVTKLRALRANKGVIVSSTGFQSGAKSVAQEHGVDLFTLAEVEDRLPDAILQIVEFPFINIFDVRVTLASGAIRALPDDADYLDAVRFTLDDELTIGEVLESWAPTNLSATPVEVSVALKGRWFVYVPGTSPKWATAITARVARRTRRSALAALMPPEMANRKFVYSNALTGATETTDGAAVPIGFDTSWQVGCYYRDLTGREYVCESVGDDGVHMLLLNSLRQHRQRYWARLVMFPQDSTKYVSIVDPADINRLRKEHGRFRMAEQNGQLRPVEGITVPEKGLVLMR